MRKSTIVLICCMVLILCGKSHGKSVDKLILHPDIRNIHLDNNKPSVIAIIVQTDIQDPAFNWFLEGPGTLSEDPKSRGNFYSPPDSISGDTEKVTVTVAVVNAAREVRFKRVTFTLFSPEIPLPQAPPSPVHSSESENLAIQKVSIKDKEEQTAINPIYFFDPGRTVTITPDITGNLTDEMDIECIVVFGEIGTCDFDKITYTSPKDDAGDYITIRISDKVSGEMLAQEFINVIIGNYPQ